MKVPSAGGAFIKRSQIPPVSKPRSVFDMTRGHKTTLDAGVVVPLLCEEILPGDTVRLKTTILMRLATLLYPLMDNIYLDVHFFFVPMRLVWTNTEKFFGQQDNPGDSTSFTIPQFTASVVSDVKGVADYFGINFYTSTNVQFNSLQHRGLRRIWNEWYRDENLQNSAAVSYGDGPDNIASLNSLLPRNKRGDRFTLALPWPQKGSTPVSFLPDNVPVGSTGVAPHWDQVTGATPVTDRTLRTSSGGTAVGISGAAAVTTGDLAFRVGGPTGLDIDFATLGIATINAFRQANAMQIYLERRARGGSRYPEYLKADWGVTSSDARLQRTEFLGGSSAPLMISAVAQTSAKVPGSNSIGDFGATGTVVSHGAGFVKSFEEHGWIYTLISVRADLNYQRGLPKQFSRRTVFDIANPAFAHIGEQPIYNKEIWYDGIGAGNPDGIFGYEERFAEYKSSYSILTGNMRSQAVDSYDLWHVAQEFGTLPTLGDTFIRENPAIDRVVATPFIDQWNLDSVTEIKMARVLPVWGVPGLGSRF